MTIAREQLELYVMGEADDAAALEQALAADDAARAMLAEEARLEGVLRAAGAAAAFCPGCRDLVSGARCDACGAALRPGGFTVERVLVANAHGRMYAARDGDGRQLALKELAFVQPPSLSATAAFEREAKVLRALEHAAIPRFVASFEEGTGVHVRYYLAQELVAGESLEARLASHWYTEAEILEVARRVLEVLVYLQSLSPMVIHRDIKPANLIERTDGTIAVVDFGAAHVQGATAGSTTIGTFGYMPVEQLAGLVDATTDPYALGASLLHLLTRREPWRFLQDASVADLNISQPLRELLATLVAPDPQARFPGAAAALEALERVARGEAPRPAPPPARPRRRRPPLPLLAGVLAAGGIGAGATHFASQRSEPGPSTGPSTMVITTSSSSDSSSSAPGAPGRPGARGTPATPRNVSPSVFEQHRIHDKTIQPDPATRAEIEKAGERVIGVFKVCIDETGVVSSVTPLKTTGFDAYDRTIEADLRRQRYRSIDHDGAATPTCTAMTFIFQP